MWHTEVRIRLAVVLSTVLVFCSAQADTDAETMPGLGHYLDESGRLSLPDGFSGNLDPAGFEFKTASDGTPSFVAGGSLGNTVRGEWEGYGGVSYGCNGTIYAMATDASGLVYLGGTFTVCGGTAANFVAVYDPLANEYKALGNGARNGVSGHVFALAASEGDVYVGGKFTEASGKAASNVARWDGSSWHSLGHGAENGVNAIVDAFAISGSDVYVGGFFTKAGGDPVNHVAQWDGERWHALQSPFEETDGVSGPVHAMVWWDDAQQPSNRGLYIGGDFNQAGENVVNQNNITHWDGSSWNAVGQGMDQEVRALATTPQDLYAGGSFIAALEQTNASRVARWDGFQWHSLGNGVENGVIGAGNVVFALETSGDDLYVGGSFRYAGNMEANHIAHWDGSQWHVLDSGLTGTYASFGLGAEALTVSREALYVGGARFNKAGTQRANRVARWDGARWQSLGSGAQSGLNDEVLALSVSGSDVYVGGEFNQAGGELANHVARWDGTQWHALGSGVENGVNFRVRALAVSDDNVYVAGGFTQAGGGPANRVARWDGSQWYTLGDGVSGGFGVVYALAVSGNDVYVGGEFSKAGSEPANNLARWDGSQWHALGSGEENGVNSAVHALTVSGTNVYVGGLFSEAGGEPANHVARWDGIQWHSLGSGLQNGVNSWVLALAVLGSDVYAGGRFDQAGGAPASLVARWDGSQWHALGSGLMGGSLERVEALAILGDAVYVGGRFTQAGGARAKRIARWDGDQWASLGSGGEEGVSSFVSALAVSPQAIHVGGAFNQAGCEISSSIATFVEDPDLIFRSDFSSNVCLE